MVATNLSMTPQPTTHDAFSRVINRIREQLAALKIQQTPTLRPRTTPQGTFLELQPIANTSSQPPFFKPFIKINGTPHLVAPWHLGFVAPEVIVDAQTGTKTRALQLSGDQQVMVAKVKIRWVATRRRLDDETPAWNVYPVEPWCAYYKCLFENPPQYDDNGNQLPSPCQPPDFSSNLVGLPIPQDPPPPRFYWTLEDPILTDDVNSSGTVWNGQQIRLVTDPVIGWAPENPTSNARWFFPVQLVATWNEQENRVSAEEIGSLNQRLVPLEEGEEDDPNSPTQFYQDKEIQIPILHAHQIRQGIYEVKTYGGPLQNISPVPTSTDITGAETTDAADPWTRYHAETLVLPNTTPPNCDYAPPVNAGDPLLDSAENHATEPYWTDGETITQRDATSHLQNPKAYLISNLQPSGTCAVDPDTGNYTGGRDQTQDSYFLDPFYEQSTTETFYREDIDRPLTMRAPRAVAFPLPFQLGGGYKIPSQRGPTVVNDKRPNPEPC